MTAIKRKTENKWYYIYPSISRSKYLSKLYL